MAKHPQSKVGLSVEQIADMIADPFYCLGEGVHPNYLQEHEPIIDEKTWVAANVHLAEEEGIEKVLLRILKNLKGEGSHWS